MSPPLSSKPYSVTTECLYKWSHEETVWIRFNPAVNILQYIMNQPAVQPRHNSMVNSQFTKKRLANHLDVHESIHSDNYESKQQDATMQVNLPFLVSSTCFGRCFRPSPGALGRIYSIWQYSPKSLPDGVLDGLQLIQETIRQLFGWILPNTVNTAKCSCRWWKTSPETCRAD